VLDVEPGNTYLLRVINAALYSEYYLKIAGHNFTVVAADASYVKPYTTDVIPVAPGETVDALVVADAPPGRYYMVALPTQVLGNSGKHITLETSKSNGILKVCFSGAGNS
jgi:laccase